LSVASPKRRYKKDATQMSCILFVYLLLSIKKLVDDQSRDCGQGDGQAASDRERARGEAFYVGELEFVDRFFIVCLAVYLKAVGTDLLEVRIIVAILQVSDDAPCSSAAACLDFVTLTKHFFLLRFGGSLGVTALSLTALARGFGRLFANIFTKLFGSVQNFVFHVCFLRFIIDRICQTGELYSMGSLRLTVTMKPSRLSPETV